MDGSLEAIEAVRSTREAAHRTRRWRVGEWLGRINTRAAMISLLFLVVVGLFASNALGTIARQSLIIDELGEGIRLTDDAATTLAASTASYGTTLGGILAGSIPPTAIAARMVPQAAQLSAALLALEQAAGADVDPAVMGLARDRLARLPALAERVQQALTGRRRGDVAPLHDEWVDAQAGFLRLVDATREAMRMRAQSGVEAARRTAQDARLVTFAGVALGVAATILVWLIVVIMITRPMGALHQSMVRIARGDVTTPVPLAEREDQLGLMARALLVFRDNLNVMRSLADRALDGARQTNTSTNEASEATAALARDLASQCDGLRRVATALDGAADAIRQVGVQAQEARDSAGDAKLLFDDGLRTIGSLGERLARDAQDPGHAGRLTAAIVDMATQANALAAAAVLEASQPVPSGAGIEAVAGQARALAARSQALALDIAEALDALRATLRDAGRSAQDVAASVETLEGRVADTARIAVDIAAALAREQGSHLDLAEGVRALAQDAAAHATTADGLAVATVELDRQATETRAAVESVAAGARLGRNA
jgi:methyl-accepting chemotaxis protein